MGRMKIYGGSWELPGVSTMEHPFNDDLIDIDEPAQWPVPTPVNRQHSAAAGSAAAATAAPASTAAAKLSVK